MHSHAKLSTHDCQSCAAAVALQSVKPLPKLKRKTVYFVKTAHARLDNDNIKALVRRNASCS